MNIRMTLAAALLLAAPALAQSPPQPEQPPQDNSQSEQAPAELQKTPQLAAQQAAEGNSAQNRVLLNLPPWHAPVP